MKERAKLIRGNISGNTLHVRLTDSEVAAVNAAVQNAKEWTTIADFMRTILREATGGRPDGRTITVPRAAYKKAQALGAELGRTPEQVIVECLDAIEEAVESDRPPLIVEEVKLRRSYYERRKVPRGRKEKVES